MENNRGRCPHYQLIVLLVAALIYIGCIISPPALMDDVDAVQAQIARNMLESGDWVTARLNGIAYLEKSPMVYWLMAISMKIFGVYDWAARIPLALSVVLLCWLCARFAAWAFDELAGLYAGLILASCIGLWLFTRIQIPDAMVTATITLAMWSLLRALDESESRPWLWSGLLAASIGVGLLLKGLIAVLFPIAGGVIYLFSTKQFFVKRTWQRLRPFTGLLIILLIAAPWHILATLANPPYFDFTMKSEPGKYHGFFWFYFFNEHVFRFLNMRHPRDYNTVPRHLFWLFHLLWLFPWSAYFPAAIRQSVVGTSRAALTRRLALCWAGFLMLFFTFSTTQEYYSMPAYPAIALWLASALAKEETREETQQDKWLDWGSRAIAVVTTLASAAIVFLIFSVWSLPTPGDISRALTQNPDAYTLSLGHMGDLTIASFAYLRTPLIVASIATILGTVCALRFRGNRLVLGLTAMMVLFFHAARLALTVFDPYMGSRPIAEALNRAPQGSLILGAQYYTFSSVFFYTNRKALILNGRVNNLEYGSYAPNAPGVFIGDEEFKNLWLSPQRFYLTLEGPELSKIENLVGKQSLHTVLESGGKYLFTNE